MVLHDFDKLREAYEFVVYGGDGLNHAWVDRETGEIFWSSELDDQGEELPDDLDESDRYLALPDKLELDLGKPLALRFAAEALPAHEERIAGFFRRAGAYARFKELLVEQQALQRWYDYEAAATERALREWCAEHGLELAPASE